VDDDGDHALIFVSNVLNGTVSRLDVSVGAKGLKVLHKTVIASGYTHIPNAAALILGPTGLAFDEGTDTLAMPSTRTYCIPARSSSSSPRGSLCASTTSMRARVAPSDSTPRAKVLSIMQSSTMSPTA
jgi:hypothetical protein